MEQQIIVLLVFAGLGLLNFFIGRAQKNRQAQNPPPLSPPPVSMRPSAGQTRPDQQMRKLMDALGLPPESMPSTLPEKIKVMKREVQSERQPARPSSRPKAKKGLAEVVAQLEKPAAAPRSSDSPPWAAESEPVPFRSRRMTPLRKLLASQEGIRQAMIAREVLGPPKALQGNF